MNKKKFWIVGILVVIIIAVAVFVIFNVLSKKDNDSTKEDKVSETQNNVTYALEGLEVEELKNANQSSIYGLAIVDDGDDEQYPTQVMALNSNGDDIKILDLEGHPSTYMLNGKLYIDNYDVTTVSHSYSHKSYIVDLNVYPYKVYQLTDGVDFDGYFDIADKYFFTRESYYNYGIVRYDLETKTQEKFVEEDFIIFMFLYNNRIYYETDDTDTGEDDKCVYCSIDLDGNNKEKVSEEDYNEILNSLNYNSDHLQTADFIKNNHVVKNDEKIYYGDKVIYTAKKGKSLEFGYSNEKNVISFYEYAVDEEFNGIDYKFYNYYIDSDKIEEVEMNDIGFTYEIFLFE